ncbi:type II methionyl aminopeptidase [Candidatus Woesearchaeota archaeon]|nr:type II methionyl aminopeptidase [Candidatus Woesearchaeota archaeon]
MDDWIKAGKITGEARDLGASLIKEGASVKEICDEVDNFMIKQGARPAFPAQISINQIAAHFCPTIDDNLTIKKEDMVKLDVGASVNGAIGDTAITVNPNNEFKEILNASKEALNNALKLIYPGTKLGDIGKEIQETIMSHNLSPIRNLGGHGLGILQIHCDPHVPNYDNHSNIELKENQIIAIEPFATDGEGYVNESSNPTIFSLVNPQPVRLPIIRDVLKEIQSEYKTLPFTTRWLTKKFPVNKVNFALKKLQEQNIIHAYPPLVEKRNGIVSQHEHSVIVKEKSIITTKI